MEKYILDKLMINNKYTLSVVESLTGGMCSEYITSFPGASNFYKGGMITYSNEIKEKLGVNKDVILKYGAVSKECASRMVIAGRKYFDSDICISFTGNAGPSTLENKMVGLVYIGINILGDVSVFSNVFSGDRNQIREKAVDFAISTLQDILENYSNN